MKHLPISNSNKRMGRPPLGMKPTVVRLPRDMPKLIDKVLGPKEKRADLIREAIEREIQRREKMK